MRIVDLRGYALGSGLNYLIVNLSVYKCGSLKYNQLEMIVNFAMALVTASACGIFMLIPCMRCKLIP